MEHLLQLFNIDLEQFKIIQITGSCGKGSTAAFMASILKEAQISYGLFTGPHLIDYEERFVINGERMESDDFQRIVLRIKNTLGPRDLQDVGHMHLMILIALLWFLEHQIGLIVFENGAGGASDPSNVFKPMIACLTEITLDHMHLLGDTIEAITRDKAAIIKRETAAVICGMFNETARQELFTLERELSRQFAFIGRDFHCVEREEGFTYKSSHWQFDSLTPSLLGDHQYQNAANAIRVMEALSTLGFNVSEEAIIRGIRRTVWPGRLEKFSRRECAVYLDGAHNPFELKTLSHNLKTRSILPQLIMVSFASRKNIVAMLRALHFPQARYIVVPSPFVERRQSKEAVEAAFHEVNLDYIYAEGVAEAMGVVDSRLRPEETLLVTGSLYLVGEMRKWLLEAGDEILE
nr:Mur ligase family protein [Pullulanibacillus pueri]